MRQKILVPIIVVSVLIVSYSLYAYKQIGGILNDFEAAIHGESIENEVNRAHLESYYPRDDFYKVSVRCRRVIMFIDRARMYVDVNAIRVIRQDDGTIKIEEIPDTITLDIEKKEGEWVIKRINKQP